MPTTRKPGDWLMLVLDRRIVFVGRKWRSKWWEVRCFCPRSRRRKDGSCKHERAVLANLKPEIRQRARIAPVEELDDA